jgi:hypothetical protein
LDNKLPPQWLTWLVIAANVLAVADLPYGYYQVLRILVTGYAGYLSYSYFRGPGDALGWGLAFVAVLYNPFLPVAMSKEFHALINLATAALLAFELKVARGSEPKYSVDSLVAAIREPPRAPIVTPPEAPARPRYFALSALLLVGVGAAAVIFVAGRGDHASEAEVAEPRTSIANHSSDETSSDETSSGMLPTAPSESAEYPNIGTLEATAEASNPPLDQDAARELVASQFAAGSAQAPEALAFITANYAPMVNFYGEPTQLGEIIRQKAEYFERWPTRRFSVGEGMQANCDGDECTITGLVDFEAEAPERDARSSGTSTFAYKIRNINGVPMIVAENGQVIRRD